MTSHGHAADGNRSPTYHTWRNMIYRCTNPRSESYKHYGAKGIRVCSRWRKFSNFLEDMGERPEGKTLDRINSTKGYRPDNCQWATKSEQGRNRKTWGEIKYRGVRKLRKKYTAAICHNKKRTHLGTYDTPEQAAEAYDVKAIELYGHGPWLNFIYRKAA